MISPVWCKRVQLLLLLFPGVIAAERSDWKASWPDNVLSAEQVEKCPRCQDCRATVGAQDQQAPFVTRDQIICPPCLAKSEQEIVQWIGGTTEIGNRSTISAFVLIWFTSLPA